MLTLLLTSVISFITSHFSQGLQLFQDKQDKSHELAILQMQMQMQKDASDERLQEIGAQSLSDVTVAAIQNDTKDSGIRWLEAFKGIVRPTIALYIMFLYGAFKFISIHYFVATHAPLFQILDATWNETDNAILGVIIGFYFGGRSITKSKNEDN